MKELTKCPFTDIRTEKAHNPNYRGYQYAIIINNERYHIVIAESFMFALEKGEFSNNLHVFTG